MSQDEESEMSAEDESDMSENATFRNPSFSLSAQLLSNLERQQLTIPTQVQLQVLPRVIDERSGDLCVNAPTGSGKTLAYALPITQVPLSPSMLMRGTVQTAVHGARMCRRGANAGIGPASPTSV
jgi:superfamily II DNA/RNA helicase